MFLLTYWLWYAPSDWGLDGHLFSPHGEFLSSWCSPDLPVREEDATLEYDPFAAAGWLFNFYSSYQLIGASSESTFNPSNVPRVPYGHQRTSLLVKIIANLHCFVPDICKGKGSYLAFNSVLPFSLLVNYLYILSEPQMIRISSLKSFMSACKMNQPNQRLTFRLFVMLKKWLLFAET